MLVRGTIFLHNQFKFKDGATSNKYLILLNTPDKGEPYLLVKTTSQQHTKPKSPGCIKKLSLYFLPGGKTFFPKDTWVQLYDLYPMADVDKDPQFKIRSSLDSKIMDKIIECLFSSQEDDLSPSQKKLLKQPLGNSINKLKDLFNGKRL